MAGFSCSQPKPNVYQTHDVQIVGTFCSKNQAATAVVIFWSTTQPDTFKRASTLYDSEVEKGTGYSLRLCVAVGAEDTLGAAEAQSWCIERGFEMLHCSLDEQGLIGVTERWRDSAGKGASLLASDSRGAVCIVEAMECCCWPGAEESSVACAGKPAAAHSSTLAEQTTSDSEKAERTTGSRAKPNVEAVCDAEGGEVALHRNRPVGRASARWIVCTRWCPEVLS